MLDPRRSGAAVECPELAPPTLRQMHMESPRSFSLTGKAYPEDTLDAPAHPTQHKKLTTLVALAVPSKCEVIMGVAGLD
jgi:hypothetical protein